MLYYETRRLLDERMRLDWLAINIYAFVFRENGSYSNRYVDELIRLFELLNDTDVLNQGEKRRFESLFLSQFVALDEVFKKEIGVEFVSNSMVELYRVYGMRILDLIDQLAVSKESLEIIELIITNHQVKDILHGRYTKIFG